MDVERAGKDAWTPLRECRALLGRLKLIGAPGVVSSWQRRSCASARNQTAHDRCAHASFTCADFVAQNPEGAPGGVELAELLLSKGADPKVGW